MAFPWAKVFEVAKLVYLLFLKGRKVNLPGVGTVTLPQKEHESMLRPLAALPSRRPNGLPDEVPVGPGPLDRTRAVALFALLGVPLVAVVVASRLSAMPTGVETAWRNKGTGLFVACAVWIGLLAAIAWAITLVV